MVFTLLQRNSVRAVLQCLSRRDEDGHKDVKTAMQYQHPEAEIIGQGLKQLAADFFDRGRLSCVLGPENRGIVMNNGRPIRLPSDNFAQVREPG